MTSEHATGRCLCGRIRFRITLPTDFVSHCHCRSCQRSHGAPFVTWTGVPNERFEYLSGEDDLRWYRSSECILWGFCSVCGSPLLYRADREGHHESPKLDRMYISAACLDHLDRPPGAHVSFEERSMLLEDLTEIPRFRGKGDAPMDDQIGS
jgi:hypothetical protein